MQDTELSYTPKGSAVCKFSVACNRFFKQEEETQKEVSYFDVSCWTRLAEVCGEYLKKGRGVRVVGRLKQDRWTDADGKGHSRIEIVAEHVEFKPQPKKRTTTTRTVSRALPRARSRSLPTTKCRRRPSSRRPRASDDPGGGATALLRPFLRGRRILSSHLAPNRALPRDPVPAALCVPGQCHTPHGDE